MVTCADAGISFTHLHWKTWVATGARAVGAYYANDCKPCCAQVRFRSYTPINFTFTDPVRDPHGQLVWSRVTISPKPPDLPSATLTLPTNKI